MSDAEVLILIKNKMRSVAILLLVVAVASALDLSRFASLVQTGTRDNEAVESVYNMLRDLKTENVLNQVQADKKNLTDEGTPHKPYLN